MYFFNFHEKFTVKQANFMGNFAEVLAESNLKMLILSIYNLMRTKYTYNQVYSYMV